MLWQIFAMWAIVMATITWFVHDERRLIANATMAQAAAFYAHAPKYRYQASEEAAPLAEPVKRTGGLTEAQRDFLEAFAKSE
tara:strand:+ start:131 stop:376 length:246 start_codon:yes stop_codon:yes gene_type:complete